MIGVLLAAVVAFVVVICIEADQLRSVGEMKTDYVEKIGVMKGNFNTQEKVYLKF